MKRLVAAIFIVVLAAAQGPAMGRKGDPAPSDRSGKNSLQLIAEAEKGGSLDEDRATLYRVYAVVGDSALPEEFLGGAPIRDGTPVLRDARSRYDTLKPETQGRLRPYLFPEEKR